MGVCPRCGTPARDGDRFCELDGTPLDGGAARPEVIPPADPSAAPATIRSPGDVHSSPPWRPARPSQPPSVPPPATASVPPAPSTASVPPAPSTVSIPPAPSTASLGPISSKPSIPPPSSSAPSLPVACGRCGATPADDGDGYCSSCGHRLPPMRIGRASFRLPPAVAKDMVLQEGPQMAAGAHPGLRHARNEDAFALAHGETARGEAFHVLVVCDGVSSSSHPEQASRTAANVLCRTLAQACRAGDIAFEAARTAMVQAIRNAHAAVCAQRVGPEGGDPPGTTCVAALVVDRRLTVGWVGDSRAYWLTSRGGELLTHDHSWANDAVARGEATFENAMRSPYAHALTRCLGPLDSGDAPPVKPDVITRELAGAGTILLCSDGLWNYYPMAEIMSALVQRCELGASPADVARFLVVQAIGRGGHDNIAAAVYRHELGEFGTG